MVDHWLYIEGGEYYEVGATSYSDIRWRKFNNPRSDKPL